MRKRLKAVRLFFIQSCLLALQQRSTNGPHIFLLAVLRIPGATYGAEVCNEEEESCFEIQQPSRDSASWYMTGCTGVGPNHAVHVCKVYI